MVKVQKGSMGAEFTDFVWKNMGPDKNGWVEVNSPGPVAKKAAKKGKEATADQQKFLALVDQASGFQTDGEFEAALSKLKEAQLIKDNKGIKNKISKLEALIEAEKTNKADEQFTELVANADEQFKTQDFDSALELYKTALEIKADEAVEAKVEECEKALLA